VGGIVFGALFFSEAGNFDAGPSPEIADRGTAFAVTADVSFAIAAVGGVLAIIGLAMGRATPTEQEVSIEGGRVAIRF
jgi:hypothetical protein